MKKRCVCFFGLLAGFCFASDFNPPAWRGLPGSTYQKWSFSTSDSSPVANDYNNPYGIPSVITPIDGDWYDQHGNQQGIWHSETINFLVPNDTATINNTKYRIQMIWNILTLTVADMTFYIHDNLSSVPSIQADIIDQYYNSGLSYTTFEVTTTPFDSTPAVYFEARRRLDSQIESVYVDEVIIDSLIIPEPVTLALLGLGGLLLRHKR